MKTKWIQTNSALMSLNDHGTPDFPVQFYTDEFENIQLGYVKLHWHKQLELSLVLRGEVLYSIGDETVHLHAGEAIFVNTNALHMSRPATDEKAAMLSILFDASVLSPGAHSAVHTKYILPILENAKLPFVVMRHDTLWQAGVLEYLDELYRLDAERPLGFELQVQNLLCRVWQDFITNGIEENNLRQTTSSLLGAQRIKSMITFIQQYYPEPVSLRQIASAANVSKSECIRAFKTRLGTSPIDYLIEYRIAKAMEMLDGSDLPISSIANECGIGNASYFTKIFRQRTGLTPTGYRNRRT